MTEFLIALSAAALGEGLVAVRVLGTAAKRPWVAATAAMLCRGFQLLTIIVVVRDSWWAFTGACIGYFIGPFVVTLVARRMG